MNFICVFTFCTFYAIVYILVCLIYLSIGTHVYKTVIAGQYEVTKLCYPYNIGVFKKNPVTLKNNSNIYYVLKCGTEEAMTHITIKLLRTIIS